MPDDDLIDSEVEPIPENESEEKSLRRRKSTRRRIWTLVILLVLCFIVNGPLARWLVLYGLNKGLASQGMTGSAEVNGTLSAGFTIHDLSYTGSEGIQTLQISKVAALYKFTELFSGKVREIDLTKGKIVIDIDRFPPSETKEEDEKTALRETLKSIHPWINQPTIAINDLDVSILKSGVQQARFTLEKFDHAAGSNVFEIHKFVATDQENRSTPEQDVHIVWKPEAASIDLFEVLPQIAVKNVNIDWTGDFIGDGTLQFIDASLKVTVAETITAKLSNGSIDSEALDKRFDLELPLGFSLAALDFTIRDWQQPIPEWDIVASADLTSLDFEDYHLRKTVINLSQKNADYQLFINGNLNTNPLNIKVDGQWLSPKSETWWSHTKASYVVDVPKLGTLTHLIDGLPEGIDLTNTSVGTIGSISIKDNVLTQADTKGIISKVLVDNVAFPHLRLNANYDSQGKSTAKLTGLSNGAIVLELDADYGMKDKNYHGELKINTGNPAWLNALAKVFKANVALEDAVSLSWSGSGNAADFTDPNIAHTGSLKVDKLQLKIPDTPKLTITADAAYNWPESVSLKSLTVREQEWAGNAALIWNGKVIDITQVELKHGAEQVAQLSGKTPYQTDITDAKSFFAQKDPWNLSVKTQPIALKKLQEWFKVELLNKMNGTTDLDIQLSGSPAHPEIKGRARASDVKGVDDGNLLPLNLAFDFYSENKQLKITGKLLEGSAERFLLSGAVPFTPSAWLNDPDFVDNFVSKAPLSAEVKINTLNLGRFTKFAPQLEKLTGTLNGTATLSGTIEKPKYLVNLDANVPLIQLKEKGIGDIKNVKLNTKFDQQQKATLKLTALVNGGKFEAGGTVDLADYEKPVFDLFLQTQYALIHRDDMVSVRANADIKLKGKMEEATLSGSIGIAESLFYKDIELIPIGVPSSEVAKVNMPALSKKKADDKLPIPEPFAKWKLDLTIRTDDPVLIRGNVASGNLTGSIKVGGTLERPAPLGTILANNVKAKLPFSILEIKRGEIKFDPKNGLNPILNIRGKSTIGAYDVSVFVYGSANSPKTAFTSYPPLPESEVMTLLATGTTTSGLENQSVATFKAFQIFLLKLQQRNEKPGGNKLFKTLLSGMDDLNLNVGETDPFTGRKFSSATVELHRRWNFTAQVDDTQQTRGLIVYVIRFK